MDVSPRKVLIDPLVDNNPVTLQMLGICSALAVTTNLLNSLIMSAALTVVCVFSNGAVSAIRNHMPSSIRIIVQITIIASLVIVVDQLLKAFAYEASRTLSVFVGLIITNCIVLGRAEAFASKNTVGASVVDALAMGLGFAVGLTSIALVREVLGAGTITIVPETAVISIPGLSESPALVFAFPAGALIVVGFLQGFYRWLGEVVNK